MCVIIRVSALVSLFCFVHNLPRTTKTIPHYTNFARVGPGIFERFVKDILFAVTAGFKSDKLLVKYVRNVHRHLRTLEYRATKDLAKEIRDISRHEDDVRDELVNYQTYFESMPKKLKEFMVAMDDVYRAQEAQRFGDYVDAVLSFGKGDKLEIDVETGKIINDVIVGGILKRPHEEQRNLHKKMRKAVREYNEGSDSPYVKLALRTPSRLRPVNKVTEKWLYRAPSEAPREWEMIKPSLNYTK